MRISVAAGVVFTALIGGVADARAQGSVSLLHVTPRLGWIEPIDNLQTVPLASGSEGAESMRLENGWAVGVDAEVELPLPLSLRGGMIYSIGRRLGVRQPVGNVSCGPDCYRTEYEFVPIAEASLLALTVAAVLRGPRITRAQPYLLLGGGVKHMDFDQDGLDGVYATAFANDEVSATLHAGVGTDVWVGGIVLSIEASDLMSTYEGAALTETESTQRRPVEIINDLTIMVGIRWMPF